MGNEIYFWIISLFIVVLSFFIAQIDPLVEQFFGGYLGFINASFLYGNPGFVLGLVFLALMLFGKRYINIVIEFFVNANLLWVEILPALYLAQFFDIKLVIIGFCIANISISNKLADGVRANYKA